MSKTLSHGHNRAWNCIPGIAGGVRGEDSRCRTASSVPIHQGPPSRRTSMNDPLLPTYLLRSCLPLSATTSLITISSAVGKSDPWHRRRGLRGRFKMSDCQQRAAPSGPTLSPPLVSSSQPASNVAASAGTVKGKWDQDFQCTPKDLAAARSIWMLRTHPNVTALPKPCPKDENTGTPNDLAAARSKWMPATAPGGLQSLLSVGRNEPHPWSTPLPLPPQRPRADDKEIAAFGAPSDDEHILAANTPWAHALNAEARHSPQNNQSPHRC